MQDSNNLRSTSGRSFSHWITDHFDASDSSQRDPMKRAVDVADFAVQNKDYFDANEDNTPSFKSGSDDEELYNHFQENRAREKSDTPKFDEGSREHSLYESIKASDGFGDSSDKAQALLADTIKRIKDSGKASQISDRNIKDNMDKLVAINAKGFLDSGDD
jgi:hypothetical protein